MNKDTLKVQALTERISELVGQYEEKIVDMRATITITVNELEQRIASLESELQPYRDAQPIQGGTEGLDVVSEEV